MNEEKGEKTTTVAVPEQTEKPTAAEKIEAKQNRLRSWPMWVGILAAIWMLASAVGLPQKIGLTNDTYNTVISAVGTILTLLGVVNNPTSKGGI